MASPPPTREPRSEAERLYAQGWRAYPFIRGAVTRYADAQPSARVSEQLWAALRLVERGSERAPALVRSEVAAAAEALMAQGWRPTSEWCRLVRSDGEEPRLIDSDVWQAMCELAGSAIRDADNT